MLEPEPSSTPTHLRQALDRLLQSPEPTAEACLALARQLYQAQQLSDGDRLTAHAVGRHPADRDLWNIRGVFLRLLGRPGEALAAFDTAATLDPLFAGALINRAGLLLDQKDNIAALDSLSRALDLEPRNPMPLTMAAQALLRMGRAEEATARFQEATAAAPTYVQAWQLLAGAHQDAGDPVSAARVLDEALRANPDHPKLQEAKALQLRLSGRRLEAATFLADLLQRMPDAGWIHFHLGDLIAADDPDRAIAHLRRALALDRSQSDYAFSLLKALCSGVMRDDGSRLDEAFGLAQALAKRTGLKPAETALLRDVFARLCAFADLERLGTFETLGRSWAAAGLNASLMFHLARAETPAQARELLAQHRLWGDRVEARAAQTPLRYPSARPTGKVRLGFLSSDLRNHPVGRFALPLFEHLDRGRFEVFVYSFFRGSPDSVQLRITEAVDGYRIWPNTPPRDAAQRIADDQLDMLIELGGPTDLNLPEILAWRPAPLQASWLGYPHSTGLSTVDHYICDPHNAPSSPDLLLEAPLLMPESWIAISRSMVANAPSVVTTLPEDRAGHLTFGSANNPYKYSRKTLASWARVVRSVPGSRFAIIRPEAGSRALRENIAANFAAEGVSPDRLDWRPISAGHLAAYGDVDISLDTLPLTGGTTTVEALMMGVPVVSFAGEAFFQRLSRSILTNAGLADLSAGSVEAFEATALRLAVDRDRRLDLRRNLRTTLLASPLGQTETFARDFYEMIHRTVMQARQAKAASQTGG